MEIIEASELGEGTNELLNRLYRDGAHRADYCRYFLSQENPLFSAVTFRIFEARSDDKTQGFVVASIDDRLASNNGKVGSLGFFECEDSQQVGKHLLGTALDWLREQGVKKAVGPMNFNTWNQYRFIIEGEGDKPFSLEPSHKDYYPGFWEAAGFTKKWSYYSGKRDDFSTILPYTKPAYEAALKEGFTIRSANADSLEDEMRIFHELTTKIFGSNVGFVPISFEEYSYAYEPLKKSFDPRLSHFIEKDGQPIGFSYSLADQVHPDSKRVILKTIGLLPKWQGKHLGAALAYAQHEEMQRQEFKEIIYALIAEGNAIGQMEYPGASIFRRYALYEIDL